LSRSQLLGVMGVWSDDLRPEDAVVLGTFARQVGFALERVQVTRTAEKRRTLLTTVFDTDPAALAVVQGPDHTVQMANSRLRELSAWPQRNPIGLSIHALFPAECISLVNGLGPLLEGVRETGHAMSLRGVTLRNPAGAQARTVVLRVVPIRLDAGADSSLYEGAASLEPHVEDQPHEALLLIFWEVTDRVRAEDRLAAQVRRAETLAAVAGALQSERELPALLQRIAQAARDLTDAESAGFLLRSAPEAPFEVSAVAGVPLRSARTLQRAFVPRLKALRPLIQHGQPLLLADAAAVSSNAESRALRRVHVHALAASPLTASGGWTMGALVVGHSTPGTFTPEHTELLAALAAQATAAVERIRAIDDAHRRADELEAVFASIADGVAIYDPEGRLTRINVAGLRIIRYQPPAGETPAQRRDHSAMRRMNGTPLPVAEMPVSRTLRGETFHDAEYIIDGVDGLDTIITASGAPLMGPNGESQGGVVVFRDVTQIRRLTHRTHEALDALLHIAAMLVAPIASSPDEPAWSLVPAPNAEEAPVAQGAMGQSLWTLLHSLCQLGIGVLGCDRMAISLVDTDMQVMARTAIAGLTPGQDAQWVASQEQSTSRGQALRIEEWLPPEVRGRFLAGEAVLLDLSQQPFTDRERMFGASLVLELPLMVENRLVGMMGLDHVRERAEEPPHVYTPDEVALAQGLARLAALAVERDRLLRVAAEVEALRAANALKEEFLSIASHELRTPLTVLQARTQATRRRLLRAGHTDAAEQFAPVQHSLNRILGLVQELLDAARIQDGPLALHLEPCDLGSLLVEAAGEAREASERTITLEGAESPGLWTLADRERMRQVVTNLLENAVKYSPPDQPISLRIWRQPAASSPASAEVGDGREEVVMCIHDKGVGIPPDEITHVFERFYRARTSSARQYGGLGLGLYIAATIIERHGGRIWAESPGPGQGTTVCASLPALDASPAQ
jgi:signal transduction histidine kinase/PAS domain-containing protein